MRPSPLLSVSVLFLIAMVGAKAQGETKLAREYKGLQITVTSADLVRGYSYTSCPHKPGVMTLTPTSGEMSARIRLSIKVLPTYALVKISRVEVLGADGKSVKTVTSFGDFNAVKDAECSLYFDTPPGFEFRALQIEDISFDLKQLAPAKESKD